MRGRSEIIEAVDEQTALAVTEGLFAVETKPSFVVADTFDSGPAVIETVKNWQGTMVPRLLADRLATTSGEVWLHQDVRLRLLRAL